MQILRTTLIADEAQAADGVTNFDLPVNPLSCILFTVKAANDTGTIANYSFVSALLAMITNLNIRYRGATIVDGSLADLAVLNSILTGWSPWQSNVNSTNNDVRCITVPICFGRVPYSSKECFPATRRGDLILQTTNDVAVTGADTLILQAETVELLDATPEQFIKYTTTSKVFNATGEHDIELPIGNDLLGVLLQGPVTPTGASFNATFGKVKMQVDNVEALYSEANWETLHGELLRRIGSVIGLQGHTHGFDDAAAGATFTRQQEMDLAITDGYAYMDLDPLKDGSYALKTAGAARVNLRPNCETASATAMRVLPVELVKLGAPA